MKKKSIILIICFFASIALNVSAQIRIGVYVASDVLSKEYKTVLATEIVNAFQESNQYIAVNRSATVFDALQFARSIQQKGHVETKQVLSTTSEDAESQICVVDVIEVDKTIYHFTATVLDASTNALINQTSTSTPTSEIGYSKLLEIAQKLTSQLLPDVQRSNLDFKSLQATSDVEMARKNVEKNSKYNISYAAFKQRFVGYGSQSTNNDASNYYLGASYDVKLAGDIMWVIPSITAFGTGLGAGLSDKIDTKTKLTIIFGSIGASLIPTIICYCVASGYERKAWKEYRKPYDDAVKDLEKARKYQKRASLQISPAVGYDWAGVGLRVTIH